MGTGRDGDFEVVFADVDLLFGEFFVSCDAGFVFGAASGGVGAYPGEFVF